MGKLLVFLSLLGMLSSGHITWSATATCVGADPCKACKNCKYCKHCATEGGKCGICKRAS